MLPPGFVADLLRRPVLIGYLAGVALIMTVDQLPKLTGVGMEGSGFFPQLWSFVGHLGQAHPEPVVFCAVTIAFLITSAWLLRALPGPLPTVVLGTAAVAVFDLDDRYGIKVTTWTTTRRLLADPARKNCWTIAEWAGAGVDCIRSRRSENARVFAGQPVAGTNSTGQWERCRRVCATGPSCGPGLLVRRCVPMTTTAASRVWSRRACAGPLRTVRVSTST